MPGIGRREHGLTYGAIATQTGLSQTGVLDICQRFAAAGMAGIASQPRGPEPGTGTLLQAAQAAEIRALICQHTPDALDLPFALWSRAAVQALVEQRSAEVQHWLRQDDRSCRWAWCRSGG